jgi:prevent-host-death family protein
MQQYGSGRRNGGGLAAAKRENGLEDLQAVQIFPHLTGNYAKLIWSNGQTQEFPMRTLSIAETKAHLSSVVDSVEAGEEVVITRHGRPVARIVAESPQLRRDPAEVLAELRAFVLTQPMIAGNTVEEMRAEDRY